MLRLRRKPDQVAADRKKRRAGITFRLFMLAIVPVIVMVLGLITTTYSVLSQDWKKRPWMD